MEHNHTPSPPTSDVMDDLKELANRPLQNGGFRSIRLGRYQARNLYWWLLDNGSRTSLHRRRSGATVRHYPLGGPNAQA